MDGAEKLLSGLFSLVPVVVFMMVTAQFLNFLFSKHQVGSLIGAPNLAASEQCLF